MRTSGVTLSSINPRYHAQIAAQLAPRNSAPAPVQTEAVPTERRIRQNQKPLMNELETAYHAVLVATYGVRNVKAQAIKIRLGNGNGYTADFFIPSISLFIEMKGPKAFRGGFENLKTAAALHTWAKFRLVWRDKKTGEWKFQEVLP